MKSDLREYLHIGNGAWVIAAPRCASNSIRHHFGALDREKALLPLPADAVACIGIVRDPLERVVSTYQLYVRDGASASYEECVDRWLAGEPDVHTVTQAEWYEGCTHFIRFEDIGVLGALPHINKTGVVTVDTTYRRTDIENMFSSDAGLRLQDDLSVLSLNGLI